jgi:hypothetical protein
MDHETRKTNFSRQPTSLKLEAKLPEDSKSRTSNRSPSPQALFNLGYMHEHGEGLPLDLHLAKRRYDEALGMDQEAAVPVKLALAGLWLRMRFGETFLMRVLDTLPEVSKSFSCAGRDRCFWKGVESFIIDTLPEVSCEPSSAPIGCCACR